MFRICALHSPPPPFPPSLVKLHFFEWISWNDSPETVRQSWRILQTAFFFPYLLLVFLSRHIGFFPLFSSPLSDTDIFTYWIPLPFYLGQGEGSIHPSQLFSCLYFRDACKPCNFYKCVACVWHLQVPEICEDGGCFVSHSQWGTLQRKSALSPAVTEVITLAS